jgi:hypothetical protein
MSVPERQNSVVQAPVVETGLVDYAADEMRWEASDRVLSGPVDKRVPESFSAAIRRVFSVLA